ncbi:MAG: PadR family transcriptional regulator [Gemmatimonas sp.]|nr:PadR family transcriptional regulator [Gemmatimonas sp.]
MAGLLGDIPYGTLDLMILKTLQAMGPLHGFGLARQIEQVSENLIELNQGSVYPALQRLQQQGWIEAEWGLSETNRRAKFYSLTSAGRKQLRAEVESWRRTARLVQRFLALET